MRGPDPQLDQASGDEALALRVDDGEFAGSEQEADGLGGVGLEVHAPETDKGAQWGSIDARVDDVELRDFITGDGAGVRNSR